MVFKAKLNSEQFNALPEPDKAHYKLNQTANAYVFQLEPVDGWDLQDVTGLRTTLSDKTEKLRIASARLESIGEATPEEIKEALEHKKNFDPKKFTSKEALETALNDVKKAHKTELEKRDAEVNKREAFIRKTLVEKECARLCADKEIDGAHDLVYPAIEKMTRVDYDEKTGEYAVRILDQNGNPRTSTEQGKTYADMRDLLLDLKKDNRFYRAFNDGQKPGSGGGPSQGAGGSEAAYTLVGEDAKNPAKYRAAMEAAKKAGLDRPIFK